MSRHNIPFPDTVKFQHFGFTFNSHMSLQDNINTFIKKISIKQQYETQNKIKLMRDCMQEQQYKIQTKLINNQNSSENNYQKKEQKMQVQEFCEQFFSQNDGSRHDRALSEIFYQNSRNIAISKDLLEKQEVQHLKVTYKQVEQDYNDNQKDQTLQSIFNQIWLDGNHYKKHWYDQE